MLLSTLVLLTPLLCHAGDPSARDEPQVDVEPARQFDFWIGEWSIQNRFLQDDGSWVEADVTRARITPVCGGNAILEEWAGPFRGTFMNGFSLRSWNAGEERWDLLLNWSTDGSGGFGTLTGAFRHGRGEFFTPSNGQSRTRYTFSDALPQTVRWDSATSLDAGVTWKTDWIMEFSRTRGAAEVTQEVLFDEDWNAGSLAQAAEARALDGLTGTWSGVRTLDGGTEQEARLRARLLNKDCLVLDVLEWRSAGDSAWSERLCVRGWVPRAQRWESWSLRTSDAVLRSAITEKDGPIFVSTWDLAEGRRLQEVLVLSDDGGQLTIEETRALPDGGWEVLAVTELTKDAG